MKTFLFFFAVTGWTLGVLVHLLSILNIDVSSAVPSIWLLHIGIFVVWIPIVFSLRKNKELTSYQQAGMRNRMNPFGFFKIISANSPRWLTIIAIAGFYYTIVNFIFFMFSQTGTPSIIDGQYVLHIHGRIIKILTEQEYHHYKANDIRGSSGHWIAFYGLAAMVLFPFRPADNEKKQEIKDRF